MRVALDHLPGVTHAPGVGRYARELARALCARDEAPTLVLSEVGPGARSQEHRLAGLERATRVQRVVRERWLRLQRDLLRRGAERYLPPVDLFHCTRPLLPALGRVPRVIPVADLPRPGSPAEQALTRAARDAAAVVVFADGLRAPVAERLGLPLDRVYWTPVGCEHFERERTCPHTAPTGAPRILVLGAVREARRPEVVLAAFEQVLGTEPEARLLLLGRAGDRGEAFTRALATSPARGAVEWRSGDVEDDLPEALAQADVLLHLAESESSPVTPLEALAAGATVVAEPLPAFVEALGPHGRWVSTAPDDVAGSVLEALRDSRDEQLRTQRRAHAAAFTWDRCAAATLEVWRGILSS